MEDRHLCKAKRLDDGEWVEGYYLYCKGATTVSFQNEHYILTFDGYGVVWHEVVRDTICKFTGLTDKEGNKIWENDIVCIESYSYLEPEDIVFGTIRYSEHYMAFCLEIEKKWIPIYECTGSYTTIYRVLGNKFDNPELLEV